MRMQRMLACWAVAAAALAAIPAQAALTSSASPNLSLLVGSSFTPTFSLNWTLDDPGFPNLSVLSMDVKFEYDPTLLSLTGANVSVDGAAMVPFANFVSDLIALNNNGSTESFNVPGGLSFSFLGVPSVFTLGSSLTFTPTFKLLEATPAGTQATVRFSGAVTNDDTGDETPFEEDVVVTALVTPDPNGVPEPSQAALVLTGLAALALATRARRRH